MKKILMVLDNLGESCGANVNIVLNFVNHIASKFEIYALVGASEIQPVSPKYNNVFKEIYTFSTEQAAKLAEFTETNWIGSSPINKISRLAKKPKILAYMIDSKYFHARITKNICIKKIEEICENNKFDVVVGVGAPYHMLQSVAEAEITCRKLAIQLDPFTNNYAMPSSFKTWRERIEKKTIHNLDMLLIADCAYEEMAIYLGGEEIKKIKPIPLPGIENTKQEIYNSNNSKIKTVQEYVDFLFVGRFYEDIRRPEYLFELFLSLPYNYRLHVVGGGCLLAVQKYQELLGDRLINHGWVSREEATDFMNKADILVNLNNTILNQLPSKLFEYISTGRPILNICKSDKCLSLKYTDKYSNALDIIEDQKIEAAASNITMFVSQKKGTLIDKEIVLENFKENTNEYFANVIAENINKLCEIIYN